MRVCIAHTMEDSPLDQSNLDPVMMPGLSDAALKAALQQPVGPSAVAAPSAVDKGQGQGQFEKADTLPEKGGTGTTHGTPASCLNHSQSHKLTDTQTYKYTQLIHKIYCHLPFQSSTNQRTQPLRHNIRN